MPDLSKNHVRWIKGFTKDQFDNLVKSVIISYFKIDDVIFTDGKGDGGIDIKIFEDKRQNKIPIQLTIQENEFRKLKEDLFKLNNTIIKYNYSNTCYFFYSGAPEECKKEEFKAYAREEYNIILEIFDAKFIGSLAENPRYPQIREMIKEILGDFLEHPKLDMCDFDKMKFDLLTLGKDATEIKSKIIQSFILHNIFIKEGLSIQELQSLINHYFGCDISKDYLLRELNWLQTNDKVHLINNTRLNLTTEENIRIEKIKEDLEFQEQYFISEIIELLKPYHLEHEHKTIIIEIIKIYKGCYKKNIEEIREKTQNNGNEITALNELKNFLMEKTQENIPLSDKIIKGIIEICEVNDYIQRICAGEVFTNLTDLPQIENYLRRQPKTVYLDTPILLHILCFFIIESNNYEDVYYKAAKDLIKYRDRGDIKIKFITSVQYIRETAFHFLNAIKLIPFSKLEFFNDLGQTSNIFYNYYISLQNDGEIDSETSFEEFLSDNGIEIQFDNEDQFLNYLSEYIENMLNDNKIETIDISIYESKPPHKYIFNEIKTEFEKHHSKNRNYRTPATIKNDCLMFCELYNSEVHEEGEPTLLTWDNSFYEIRKKYHRNHEMAFFWHLFRPSKFLDHLSLVKLKINSSALTKDLMSLIDDDFNLQEKVKSLKDILVRIINLETESGFKLSKEISKIRKDHIYNLDKPDVEKNSSKSQPIDEIVVKLSTYYINHEGEYSFIDFKKVIDSSELIDEIIAMWKSELNYLIENDQIQSSLYSNMDAIIKKFKNI
jgi:hypothetical protein